MAVIKNNIFLANYTQKLISLINRVRDIGISYPLDLPTIVFCGKQSSGKSSLIESISGITLPRAAGTCTRIPVEIRMSDCEQNWACRITIRRDSQSTNKNLNKFKVDVQERKDVAKVVSEAQEKILGEREKLKFSKSVGKDIGNLSLIDLPGLIEATENSKDEMYIKLVKELVWSYIKAPNTIIAMVLSCKEDMENQSIKTLAVKADPKGTRTVGILTKPDTVEKGCHSQFLNVLAGKTFSLSLGYFVVKNLSQDEIDKGQKSAEALILEKRFFETTPPWNKISKSLTGCGNLSERLGKLLADNIKKQLPALMF